SCVRELDGMTSDVLLVPLIGHTFGHAGVAVDCGDMWLLLAGDAYFYHKEMNVESPGCTPGLRMYQKMMEKNRRARLWNQERLRDLRREKRDFLLSRSDGVREHVRQVDTRPGDFCSGEVGKATSGCGSGASAASLTGGFGW